MNKQRKTVTIILLFILLLLGIVPPMVNYVEYNNLHKGTIDILHTIWVSVIFVFIGAVITYIIDIIMPSVKNGKSLSDAIKCTPKLLNKHNESVPMSYDMWDISSSASFVCAPFAFLLPKEELIGGFMLLLSIAVFMYMCYVNIFCARIQHSSANHLKKRAKIIDAIWFILIYLAIMFALFFIFVIAGL